jgi:magnesium transporter
MIKGYVSDKGRLVSIDSPMDHMDQVIWFDLLHPTLDEELMLGRRLGITLPTREDMEEIEISSRLYFENDAAVMTATLPSQVEGDSPILAPVSFILTDHRLVTVRYHEPRSFFTFAIHAEKAAMGCTSGESALVALLEAVVDRLADILEHGARDLDKISRDILQQDRRSPLRSKDFQHLLREIGLSGDLTSDIRDCLATMERLVGFLGHALGQRKVTKELKERVKTLSRDIRSLADYSGFMSQKITFLLDATLGMISIEQNGIIKILSVASVVFLPPTLIASFYGMNFQYMPELDSPYGYPIAFGAMVLSAILPYLFFKYKKWL